MMMRRGILSAVLLLALIVFSFEAMAQDCSAPDGDHGVIQYNADYDVMQGCTPRGWVSLMSYCDGAGCGAAAPDPCVGVLTDDDIGMTCADGTIYAGLSPDGNVPMFTTPADAPSLMAWNDANGTGTVDTTMVNCISVSPGAQTSCRTGRSNTDDVLVVEDSNSAVAGIQPHRAARYCHCLGKPLTGVCSGDPTGGAEAHGHADWYLPALDELNVLYVNLARDGGADITPGNSFGFNRTGLFPAGWYWSSSERTNSIARSQRFSDGLQLNSNKDNEVAIRCVRRGP
ncbi:MAG: hypothetical protein ACK4VI_02665 [Alphaproteobacteria bacterium]